MEKFCNVTRQGLKKNKNVSQTIEIYIQNIHMFKLI